MDKPSLSVDRDPRAIYQARHLVKAWGWDVLGYLGVCFGAIHCIAWAFSFPTDTYRVVDLANFESIYIFLGILLAAWMSVLNYYFDFTLYILARVGTLVLAFTSRPPGTYETVHWTTFTSHI